MADNSAFNNWMDSGSGQKTTKLDKNSDWYYRWLGTGESTARALNMRVQPFAVASLRSELDAYAPKASTGTQGTIQPPQEDSETPGEWVTKALGKSFDYNPVPLAWDYVFKNWVKPEDTDQSFLADARRFAGGFYQGASRGGMQILSNIAAPTTDFVTGNIGKAKSYQLSGNEPGDLSSAAGVGRTLGSLVPEIGLALAGGALIEGGLATAARTAAVRTAAGEAVPLTTRIGARLAGTYNPATGMLEKSALRLGGMTLPIEATQAARVGATVAQGGLGVAQSLPGLATGQMSGLEAAANVGLAALPGPFTAGTMTGSVARNIAFDTGVNVATGAAQAAVPLLPGGQEFNAEDAWKQILFQTTLGAAFGTTSAISDARATRKAEAVNELRQAEQRVAEQRAAAQQAAQAEADASGFQRSDNMFSNIERVLFGDAASTEGVPQSEAGPILSKKAETAYAADLKTIVATPDGGLQSLSDNMIRGNTDQLPKGLTESEMLQAAALERKVYAGSILAAHFDKLDTIARIFDLEVTPEDLKRPAVLQAKIENEILNQAANGKGIDYAEAKLQETFGYGIRYDQMPSPTQQASPTAQTEFIPRNEFESGLYTQPEVETPPMEAVAGYRTEPVARRPISAEESAADFQAARAQERLGNVEQLPSSMRYLADTFGPENVAAKQAELEGSITSAKQLAESTGESVSDILADSEAGRYFRAKVADGLDADTSPAWAGQIRRESTAMARNNEIGGIEKTIDEILSKEKLSKKDARQLNIALESARNVRQKLVDENRQITDRVTSGQSSDFNGDIKRLNEITSEIERIDGILPQAEQVHTTVRQALNDGRKRKAKSEPEALLLSELEDAGVETDIVIPKINPAPEAAVANRIGRAISGVHERTKVGSEQNKRTASQQLANIGKLIQGKSVEVYAGYKGTKSNKMNAMIEFIAEADGTEPTLVRELIRDGAERFADGRIIVSPVEGRQGYYKVSLDADEKFKNVLTQSLFSSSVSDIDPEVKAGAKNIEEYEKKINALESRYDDIEGAYQEDADPDVMYASTGRGGITNRPKGAVSVESPSEILKSDFQSPANKPTQDDAFTAKKDRETWRKFHNKKLDQLQEAFTKWMRENNVAGANNFASIRSFLIGQAGPYGFRDINMVSFNTNVPDAQRRIIQDAWSKALPTRPRTNAERELSSALMNYLEHNAIVPDSYFQARLVDMIPTISAAAEEANNLAQRAGIDDFQNVMKLAELDAAGSSEGARKAVFDRWEQTEFQPTQFDELEIRDKVESTYLNPETGAESKAGWEKIMKWARGKKGADKWRELLDRNIYGQNEPAKFNLRSMPFIANSAIVSSILLAHDYVQDFQDDETYAGIPGRIIKDLIGNDDVVGYAMASMTPGVMKMRYKVNATPGSKNGMRARMANSIRKSGNPIAKSYSRVSMARQPMDVQLAATDVWMAKNFPTLERGSADYQQEVNKRLSVWKSVDVTGTNMSNVLTKIVGLDNSGTLTGVQLWLNDRNLAGMRSEFLNKYVRQPAIEAEGKVRELLNQIASPVNDTLPKLLKKYRDRGNSKFVEAFIENDWRMSEVQDIKGSLDKDAFLAKREEVKESIKKDYFTVNGVFNAEMYADYLAAQEALNVVRAIHYRVLIANSMGIPVWKITEHKGQLLEKQAPIVESIGALNAAYKTANDQALALDKAYTSLRNTSGKAGADQAMPTYKADRLALGKAMEEYQEMLNTQKFELDYVEKQLSVIDKMDEAIATSQENGYIFRHRDQQAPFVLRLEFDKDTGIANVRQEYQNSQDAQYAERQYLRSVLSEASRNKIYSAEAEIAKIQGKDELTEADYKKIAELEKTISNLSGMKSVADMDDAEIFKFAASHKILRYGNQPTIINRGKSERLIEGTPSARKVLQAAMSSGNVFRASIIGRTTTENAMSPRYVEGKGNGTLINDKSGNVVTFRGEDSFKVDDMINTIEELVDQPIDRDQIKNLLERHYTYRDQVQGLDGKMEQTVYVDMGALRQIAERFMDPYIPNLTKRNNWDGYWDPEGKWTLKQKEEYFLQSIEGMRRQIQEYSRLVTVRASLQEGLDILDKYEIDNGTREYVVGMMGREDKISADMGVFIRMAKKASRLYSIWTLATNLSNMAGNRIYGITSALTDSYYQGQKRYGVVQRKADGTDGPMMLMNSMAEAEAFLYDKESSGDATWRMTFTTSAATWFSPRKFGLALGAAIAPKRFLKYVLAPNDVEWQTALKLVERSKLYEGGVQGSYAIQAGVESGTWNEKVTKGMTWASSKVEEANNYTSIIMSVANNRTRSGMTKADFIMMSKGQQSEAMKHMLKPYEEKLQYGVRALALIDQKIEKINTEIEDLSKQGTAMSRRRVNELQRELSSLKQRRQLTPTEESLILDRLQEYIVQDRALEQGSWDAGAKSKLERWLETGKFVGPVGTLTLTMTGPAFRSMNMWQGLARDAANVYEGSSMVSPKFRQRILAKGKAYTPIFVGAGITTMLMGIYAAPLALAGMFVVDIAEMGEEIYSWFDDDTEDRLTKASKRQYWENLAESIAIRYGKDPKAAKDFVRAYFTEGLIRFHADMNVTPGGGFFEAAQGPGLQMMTKQAKGMYEATMSLGGFFSGENMFDVIYGISSYAPTSVKNITQATYEGVQGIKLDRDGNPIVDPNSPDLKAKQASMGDVLRHAFTGRRWSETRSKIAMIEGGVPIYTEEDKLAFGMAITRTPAIRFGATMKQAGMKEVETARIFAQDAEQLQRLIRSTYDNAYSDQVAQAKKALQEEYNSNPSITLPDGNTLKLREMYAIIASEGGLKQEFELRGKGAESVHEAALKMAERWGRSRATGQAVANYYQGRVPIEVTDDLFKTTVSPDQYAVYKLQERFLKAYKAGTLSNQFQSSLEDEENLGEEE